MYHLFAFALVCKAARQILFIERIACQPVDSGEVPLIRELAHQRPKYLNNVKRGLNNRVGQITARRTNRTDNRYCTLSLRSAETLNAARSFVE
jgi:hypothetical protein